MGEPSREQLSTGLVSLSLHIIVQLKSQGLLRDTLHIIFTAIVLSVVTYALPSFAGQLSVGDKACLGGLFMVALCNRETIYIFMLFLLLSSFCFLA